MKGLNFYVHKPIQESAPNRVDIACFVGLVSLRCGKLPTEVATWLQHQGWLKADNHLSSPYHRNEAMDLLDVPVPIEDWDSFDALFAWDKRYFGGEKGITYLGAAVRSFFAQGGRRCYIIRVGDPLPFNAARPEREALLAKLIPGYPMVVSSNKSDRTSWQGIGHLFGLPDVSFLSLPDLPDLTQSEQERIPSEPTQIQAPPEQFVVCSEPSSTPPADNVIGRIPAPRCDELGYCQWAQAVNVAANFIATHRREVQLVASLPLPEKRLSASDNMLRYIHQKHLLSGDIEKSHTKLCADNPHEFRSVASAFVQLCYPWVRTIAARRIPEELETPEGALIGLLAKNALTRGTFRSATKLQQRDIVDLSPVLRQEQIHGRHPQATSDASPGAVLIDRVTLFSHTPEGIKMISDVTTSNDVQYRPASINRLFSLIIRAARRIGEEFVFESSGEALWSRLRDLMSDLLLTLYKQGGLRGTTPADAFHVRCDRSTMTQHDIDMGRVIAIIQFDPAASIETMNVVLTMDEGSHVSLSSLGIQEDAA
ncbi:MAG: hypothetical protein KKC76_21145 [Proteobacteria bacterium]|nr:hypothetical protein [Pseudomonadota bacterium]MBU4295145.1 hypothetical protein [Pseudomonadota bacterium]MCG2747009.1 hypothetical protein [Desulfobulbaceae bacterium]